MDQRRRRAQANGSSGLALALSGWLSLSGLTVATPPAGAQSPVPTVACAEQIGRDESAKTWTLRADCQTDQPLRIPDGWTFDGAGHAVSVVEPARGAFIGGVIERRRGSAAVRDVTIDGSGLRAACVGEIATAGVLFQSASGTIRDVRVINFARPADDRCTHGILVRGEPLAPGGESGGDDTAEVEVIGNELRRVGYRGVSAMAGASVRMSGNTVSDSGDDAIHATDAETRATITGNTIERAGYFGIALRNEATGFVADNHIVGARTVGIGVGEGATASQVNGNRIEDVPLGIGLAGPGTSATLAENRLRGTTERGISVSHAAEAMVIRNTVMPAGGVGIGARGGATLTAGSNTIIGGDVGVVAYDPGTAAALRGNVITRPGEIGIHLGEGVTGTVTGNTVVTADNPDGAGIMVSNGAAAVTENNTVSGGAVGILYRDSRTSGTISRNEVSQTARDGIAVILGANATITDNRLHDLVKGIWVAETTMEVVITGNQVDHARDYGIGVSQAAPVSITGNTMRQTRRGIAVVEADVRELAANTVEGASEFGIVVSGASDYVLRGNTVRGSGLIGIVAHNGENVWITRNQVTGPDGTGDDERVGIKLESITNGIASANIVSSHFTDGPILACGVWLDGDTTGSGLVNNLAPAPGNEEDLCVGSPPAGFPAPAPRS